MRSKPRSFLISEPRQSFDKLHHLIYKGKGKELNAGHHSPKMVIRGPREFRSGSPANSNGSLPWIKKKKKITKKLNADKEFETCYSKVVQEVGHSIADPEQFKKEFTLSAYGFKLEKLFKSQIKEKKEFILKFDKNQDIYRQNDFKYNSVKFGKEMWNLKFDDSLRYIQKEFKLIDFNAKY
jgi:hypothetical protein